MAKKKISFEDALKRLEEIVSQLEDGVTSLDDSVKLYQEGVELAALCGDQLHDAFQKVTVLKSNLDGELYEKPFEIAEED